MTVDFSQLQGFSVVKGNEISTDPFEFYDGEVKVLDGYTVTTVPTIHLVGTYNSDDVQYTLKSGTTDTYIAQFEIAIGNIERVYVTGLAEQDTPPTPTEIEVDFSALSGFDVIEGETFDTTQFTVYEIELQVKEGYTVTDVPKLNLYRENDDTPVTFQLMKKPNTENIYYYSYNNDYSDIERVTVSGTAISEIQSLYTEYPLITCYKVTDKDMEKVANLRFQNTATDEKEDLGDYILSVVRYPCDISVLNRARIKIGYFQTDIETDLIEKQVNTFSLGTVAIKGLKEDTSDIAQCEITLVLPYFGLLDIDSKYINTDIEVVYKVDIVTNTCIIKVYSDEKLINIAECNIGYDLPYILKGNAQNIAVYNALHSNVLKYNEPKVIVRQKDSVKGFFNETNIEVENLNSINGFIVATDYTIENIPTEEERKMIVALMQQGVIV